MLSEVGSSLASENHRQADFLQRTGFRFAGTERISRILAAQKDPPEAQRQAYRNRVEGVPCRSEPTILYPRFSVASRLLPPTRIGSALCPFGDPFAAFLLHDVNGPAAHTGHRLVGVSTSERR